MSNDEHPEGEEVDDERAATTPLRERRARAALERLEATPVAPRLEALRRAAGLGVAGVNVHTRGAHASLMVGANAPWMESVRDHILNGQPTADVLERMRDVLGAAGGRHIGTLEAASLGATHTKLLERANRSLIGDLGVVPNSLAGFLAGERNAQSFRAHRLLQGLEAPSGIDELRKSVLGAFTETPRVAAEFKKLLERLQPRNLRGSRVNIAAVVALMEHEGLPFCLVPDAETAELLVDAPDASARRGILQTREKPIFETCEITLALCVATNLAVLGSFIRKAMSAYRDGHPEAAQALANNVVDRLVNDHPNKGQLVNPTMASSVIETLGHREAAFWRPVPGAHAKAHSNSPPADGYSRHATAHQITEAQYTRANALHAVMLATSLLGYRADLW